MFELDGRTVNICGLKYTIKMVDKIHRCQEGPKCEVCGEDAMDTFGMIREKTMVIEIAKDLNDQQALITLFHECMHGYLFMWTNYKKMDPEFVCDFSSTSIICLLRDNPWIANLFIPEAELLKKHTPITNSKVIKPKVPSKLAFDYSNLPWMGKKKQPWEVNRIKYGDNPNGAPIVTTTGIDGRL